MYHDYETGAPESHWLQCYVCGHRYQALGDEYPECPHCGVIGHMSKAQTPKEETNDGA
jgi:rRNA maturation endonuclease Nob1